MLRPALAAVALTIALAGCGGESDEEAVRETVADYIGAFANEDADRICELMTPRRRDELGGRECATYIGRAFDDAEPVLTVEPDDLPGVTVSGDRATVGRENDPMELHKVDGRWFIDIP